MLPGLLSCHEPPVRFSQLTPAICTPPLSKPLNETWPVPVPASVSGWVSSRSLVICTAPLLLCVSSGAASASVSISSCAPVISTAAVAVKVMLFSANGAARSFVAMKAAAPPKTRSFVAPLAGASIPAQFALALHTPSLPAQVKVSPRAAGARSANAPTASRPRHGQNEGMRQARQALEAKPHTFVQSRCASPCQRCVCSARHQRCLWVRRKNSPSLTASEELLRPSPSTLRASFSNFGTARRTKVSLAWFVT